MIGRQVGVNHRGGDVRMAEKVFQLKKACPIQRLEQSICMAQMMKMQMAESGRPECFLYAVSNCIWFQLREDTFTLFGEDGQYNTKDGFRFMDLLLSTMGNLFQPWPPSG